MSDNHRRQRCTPADIDGQRQDIQDNLRSLRVGQLAAVNLRLPGGGRVDARFDDQLAAMAAARGDGLIAGVGLTIRLKRCEASVGDAVPAPPLPVPGHRTCCQRRTNLPSCVAPLWRITTIR
jgi:hypothetical protein